jgi:putative nucleotidyltransferase with HDIG domain
MATGTLEPHAVQDTGARWAPRPWLALFVRAIAWAFPFAMAVLVTAFAARHIGRPSGLAVVGWWALLAVIATAVATVADRVSQELFPLAALLQLSLLFPDRAPSRWSIARRSGSVRQLRRRVDAAGEPRDVADACAHVLTLVAALSRHDRCTRGHSERVRAYVDLLAKELGVAPEDADRLRWAGLLHDIGKLDVPAEILNKKGRLEEREREEIRRHPEAGARLAAPLAGWLGPWAHAIDQHHERLDGTGYPNGLAGEEISLAARIVAVVDCYDVMTSSRSYKRPVSSTAARRELQRCAGTQFDPQVVDAFLRIPAPRLRFVTGPLAWLAQIPLVGGPAVGAAGAAGGSVPAGGLAWSAAATLTVGWALGLTAAPAQIASASSLPRSGAHHVETQVLGATLTRDTDQVRIAAAGMPILRLPDRGPVVPKPTTVAVTPPDGGAASVPTSGGDTAPGPEDPATPQRTMAAEPVSHPTEPTDGPAPSADGGDHGQGEEHAGHPVGKPEPGEAQRGNAVGRDPEDRAIFPAFAR